MIRYLALERLHHEIRTELDAAIAGVVDRGQFILGDEVRAFEVAWAAFVQCDHTVAVGSGQDALEIALQAVGVRAGDEVLVPSNTYVATWMAVSRVGAIPVGIDPDPATHLITPEALAAAACPRTRAVLPVHLYGTPVDGAGIAEVARDLSLAVVEDAAQAHGARYHGHPVGYYADATAWSFYPGKNLGALGDGGAVTTSDPAVAERARLLGNYGSAVKHHHEIIGGNSRLDEVQAAVLRVKLRHLDRWNARRSAIAQRHIEALSQLPVGLPLIPQWAEPVWHVFVITHPRRDELAEGLRRLGVETLQHYPTAPWAQPAYAGHPGRLQPVADALAASVLSLPVGPELRDDEVESVIAAVREAVSELSSSADSAGGRRSA